MRKPFQGIWNIMRFNWHFYLLSFLAIIMLLLIADHIGQTFRPVMFIVAVLIYLSTIISLAVSWYIYDLSGLYNLDWISASINQTKLGIVNIHAGFDETSNILKYKFPNAELLVFDFYDPQKHTEVSIKRARKAYPPFPNTRSVNSNHLPAANHSADIIFVIFAAHEIRKQRERIDFFEELKRILKPAGEIIVTEHLRDVPNFLAYNIGFLHFYSKQNWVQVFESAELTINNEQKLTPFISTFTLINNGFAA